MKPELAPQPRNNSSNTERRVEEPRNVKGIVTPSEVLAVSLDDDRADYLEVEPVPLVTAEYAIVEQGPVVSKPEAVVRKARVEEPIPELPPQYEVTGTMP